MKNEPDTSLPIVPWGIRHESAPELDDALIRLIQAAREMAEEPRTDRLSALQRAGYSLALAIDTKSPRFPVGQYLHFALYHMQLRAACGLKLDGNGFARG